MVRLIYCCFCVISLLVTSCNNNDVNTGNEVPGQEKKLRELISLYPDSFLLREDLVEYLRLGGNYGKAISETEAALKKDSLNDRFLGIKATLHFENGDTINAIKSFEKAISINPRTEYIMSLGSLYAQTKNTLALEVADALLQTPAANAQKEAIFIKGMYYNYTGDPMKAIPFFDTCLTIDYRYLLAYREKAICLYDLKKYTAALDVLQKGITVQKNFDEGYYWMGKCYEKLNKKKAAVDSYRAALQIDTGYVEAKNALAGLGVNN